MFMRYRLMAVAFGVVLMLVGTNEAIAQRGGFGGGGGRRGGPDPAMMERMNALRTFEIEMIWHDLSIRMDTPDTQLLGLRTLVKNASTQKRAMIELAEKSKDWGWVKDQLENSHKQFDKDLKSILSEADMKRYEKLVKEREERASEMMGRFRR
jgi:hypothetical protein